MTLPVLYSFRRCPFAMRARMALLASGQRVELREVLLRDKPAEMIAASPKATVPVLVLPDGRVVDESLDIMLWALAQNDPDDWLLAGEASAHQDSRDLIAALQAEFKPHLDRYKYPNRYEGEPAADHRAIAMDFLADRLVPRLADHADLFRASPSLADVALFPFVRQFANTDRAWFDMAAPASLKAWLVRHVDSDLFAAAMVKKPVWVPGETGPVFGGEFGKRQPSVMV